MLGGWQMPLIAPQTWERISPSTVKSVIWVSSVMSPIPP